MTSSEHESGSSTPSPGGTPSLHRSHRTGRGSDATAKTCEEYWLELNRRVGKLEAVCATARRQIAQSPMAVTKRGRALIAMLGTVGI